MFYATQRITGVLYHPDLYISIVSHFYILVTSIYVYHGSLNYMISAIFSYRIPNNLSQLYLNEVLKHLIQLHDTLLHGNSGKAEPLSYLRKCHAPVISQQPEYALIRIINKHKHPPVYPYWVSFGFRISVDSDWYDYTS